MLREIHAHEWPLEAQTRNLAASRQVSNVGGQGSREGVLLAVFLLITFTFVRYRYYPLNILLTEKNAN